MEFCAGGDLANYIKKRGRVEGLEYIPSPGAAPTYYPHPKSGGLDEIVVRSFLRQLGEFLYFQFMSLEHRMELHTGEDADHLWQACWKICVDLRWSIIWILSRGVSRQYWIFGA